MIQYKSIDQSQFAEGEDIEKQEKLFDSFLKENLGTVGKTHTDLTDHTDLSSKEQEKSKESEKSVESDTSTASEDEKSVKSKNQNDSESVKSKNQNDSKSVRSVRSVCEYKTAAPYILLRTCNRSEIYYDDGKEDGVPDEVARHLYRVVSGLESAIVGERAVQGQVKEAYYTAKAQRPLPAALHKLFQGALQVGKRVRNETEISHGAVSHSLAAIEILEQEILGGQVCYLPNGKDANKNANLPNGKDANKTLKDAHITIIGVNKLTADILKFLQNKGAKMVFLANRSQIKAHYLADPLGIKVYTLDEKKEFLSHTDILISATSAPHLIIHKEDIPEDKRMLAIDLAFPRDIDSRLNDLPNVRLYNIRDVEQKVRQNLDVREAEVEKAERIIEEEIEELRDALERRKKYLKEKCI